MVDSLGQIGIILYYFASDLTLSDLVLSDTDLAAYVLVVTCWMAYFGLMSSLGETLSGIGENVRGPIADAKLESISHVAVSLKWLMTSSAILLLFNLVNSYDMLIPKEWAGRIAFLTQAFVVLLTPLSVACVALAVGLVASFVYRFKRDAAEHACRMWVAVVRLKRGRVLRGRIFDFGFLTSDSLHLTVYDRDFTRNVIPLSEVAVIFLQPEYDQSETIRTLKFRPATKTLTLTKPHVEQLPARRQFVGDRFTVLDLDKPTTTARYAIVRSTLLTACGNQGTSVS